MFTKISLFTADRLLKGAWERLMALLVGVGHNFATNTEQTAMESGDLVAASFSVDNGVELAISGQGVAVFLGVCVEAAPANGIVKYKYAGDADAKFVAGLTLNEGDQVFASLTPGLATNVTNHNDAIGTVVNAGSYSGLAGDLATVSLSHKTRPFVPAI